MSAKLPPPTSATSLMVWCGDRNGLRVTSAEPLGSTPATEWILVVSRASWRLSGGNMVGNRRASMVLPAPGGPMRMTLCPPAAEISKARAETLAAALSENWKLEEFDPPDVLIRQKVQARYALDTWTERR